MEFTVDHEFVVSYFAEHREDIVRDIRKLVAIDSAKGTPEPNAPFGPGPRKALDAALQMARDMGFETRDMNGYCGEINWPAGDAWENRATALGHLDIVPIGEGWTRDPLGSSPMEGNLLYGRGSGDNKGPVVTTLYALAALKASGFVPKRTLQIVVGCDEECGMSDIEEYLKLVPAPKYAFSPDAGFPAVYGEKGFVKGDFTWNFPAESCVREMHAGVQVNVVPHHAYAMLRGITPEKLPESDYITVSACGEDVKVEAEGLPSHAAYPQGGRNAIGLLMKYLAKVLPLGDGALPGVGFMAENLGLEYDGAKVGVSCSDEISGPLTLNVGILRGDEKSFSIRIDIRNPVTCDEKATAEKLEAAFRKAGFDGTSSSEPSLYVPKDHPLIRALHGVYQSITGDTRGPATMGGGTYARTMPCAVAYGPGMPGYGGGGAHAADECVDVAMLLKAGEIYYHAFAALAELE